MVGKLPDTNQRELFRPLLVDIIDNALLFLEKNVPHNVVVVSSSGLPFPFSVLFYKGTRGQNLLHFSNKLCRLQQQMN